MRESELPSILLQTIHWLGFSWANAAAFWTLWHRTETATITLIQKLEAWASGSRMQTFVASRVIQRFPAPQQPAVSLPESSSSSSRFSHTTVRAALWSRQPDDWDQQWEQEEVARRQQRQQVWQLHACVMWQEDCLLCVAAAATASHMRLARLNHLA